MNKEDIERIRRVIEQEKAVKKDSLKRTSWKAKLKDKGYE